MQALLGQRGSGSVGCKGMERTVGAVSDGDEWQFHPQSEKDGRGEEMGV